MKIKQYHYILLIILLMVIFYKLKETFWSTSSIPITRSFTGPRNHFVGMGYPDWGDDGFK